MRFEQRISACLRPAAAAALACSLFASGRPVFASEQTPGAQAQPPATATTAPVVSQGPQFQITADDAVRMALENNLGIRAERLSPQVQALVVSQTRAAYAPIVFSNTTKNSNSNPPPNFLSGNNFVTAAGLRTNGGIAQSLKWGGGRYQA